VYASSGDSWLAATLEGGSVVRSTFQLATCTQGKKRSVLGRCIRVEGAWFWRGVDELWRLGPEEHQRNHPKLPDSDVGVHAAKALDTHLPQARLFFLATRVSVTHQKALIGRGKATNEGLAGRCLRNFGGSAG